MVGKCVCVYACMVVCVFVCVGVWECGSLRQNVYDPMKSDNENKEPEMGRSRVWWSAKLYVCTCVCVCACV